MFISEHPGPNHGCRDAAIAGLKKIGDLCRERDVDTIVISDTHWLVNAGYHINANPVMEGVFTSTEFPQMLSNMPYKHRGDPELGNLIAATATRNGVTARLIAKAPDSTNSHDRLVTDLLIFVFQGFEKRRHYYAGFTRSNFVSPAPNDCSQG